MYRGYLSSFAFDKSCKKWHNDKFKLVIRNNLKEERINSFKKKLQKDHRIEKRVLSIVLNNVLRTLIQKLPKL